MARIDRLHRLAALSISACRILDLRGGTDRIMQGEQIPAGALHIGPSIEVIGSLLLQRLKDAMDAALPCKLLY